MYLIVECTVPKLVISLSVQGLHRLMIFNDMDEAAARRLLPQYGYSPAQVGSMAHVGLSYRREVADAEVADLLERQRALHPEQPRPNLLDALRLHLPEAERILYHQ